MKRYTLAALVWAILPVVAWAQGKPIKADVVIKQDDKGGTAKVGDTIEIKVNNPPLPVRVSDLKVTIRGKALDPKEQIRDTVDRTPAGKPLIGSGYKSIYVRAKQKGTAKVKVEFKKGKETHTHEYTIEVK